MIKKSMSIVRKETVDSLTDVINNSGLPMFVIAPILKDLLEQAVNLANKEYEQDLTQYETAMKQEGGNDIAGN